MSSYKCFYNQKSVILQAKDLWDAKQKAVSHFKVPKSKTGLVAVVCIQDSNNEPVIHSTASIG